VTSKNVVSVPARMEQARQRLEQWRTARTGREPIPEKFWNSAVGLAGLYGLFQTAQTLRLDYGKLKRLMESPRPAAKTPRLKAPAFVELIAPQAAGASECMLELESTRSGRLRIQWKGAVPPELAGLIRMWRDAGA
jgi:hypothetical protein